MDTKNIRNFCIIAHIDHGKSTLADRFLETTGTVDSRHMHAQYLDQLDLERERGITIKMAPVRMIYHPELGISNFEFRDKEDNPAATQNSKLKIKNSDSEYILNLIDTPGHSDFAYEVSRTLTAVEGGILLVDATQGIQAQTLSNFKSAKEANLKIIGAINKIDLFKNKDESLLHELRYEVALLLGVREEDIFMVSAKTGEGVKELLSAVIEKVPPPRYESSNLNKALVFDSFYDDHKGIVASVRVFEGEFKREDVIVMASNGTSVKAKEVGYFSPQVKPSEKIKSGEIGYIATGIKDTSLIKIGDTVLSSKFEIRDAKSLALPGYKEPNPVVFVSFYPEDADDYDNLKRSLEKLHLNDSSLKIEPDQNEILGRGFKVGFLGKLHFEITAERLEREFNVSVVSTFPSVAYKIKNKGQWDFIIKPEDLPNEYEEIWEPVVKINVLVPSAYLSNVISLQGKFRMSNVTTKTVGNAVDIEARMPLSELISDFDDQLKSTTSGYASFSYEFSDYERAEIVRVDSFVAGEPVPGLSRFFPKESVERESRKMVEKLKETLPRQQFSQAIQAKINGKVIAREDIPALRKELGNFGKNGGDRSRKMKLWAKQKRGKEKLKTMGKVRIPPEIFKELIKK